MEKEDFKIREEEVRGAAKEGAREGVVFVPNAGIKYLIKQENPVLK